MDSGPPGSSPLKDLNILQYGWILYQLSHEESPRILECDTIPSPVDLPDPGIEPGFPALQTDSLPAELWGKPIHLTSVRSDQISCSVVSDSFQPHGLQHPGLPVHHQLPEFTQTHVHWVGDALQPSHPLSSPSPPAFSLSQHQCLVPVSQFFASGGQSIGTWASASVLPMIIRDWFPLGLAGLISLQSKALSRVFSNSTVQKHQFFCTQLSL